MMKQIPNDLLLPQVTEFLMKGMDVILLTKGNSMLPFIRGDRDSVKLRRKDDVSVGDVVLARLPGERYVLHRVIRIDGEDVTLMGDGNIVGTESCRKEDVSGTVIEIIGPDRKARKVNRGRIWKKLLPFRRYLLFAFRILRIV